MSSRAAHGPASLAPRVLEPEESSPSSAEGEREQRSPRPRLHLRAKGCPAALPKACATAMGSTGSDKAYFQRGSLLWFAVITLSFGYYTVKAGRGVSAPFSAGFAPASEDRSRRRNSSPRALGIAGEGTRPRKMLARWSARAFRLCPKS